MPKILPHVHKYLATILGGERIVKDETGKKKLIKTGGYPVFKCVVPDCPTYYARNMILGRRTICWVCEEGMEMKAYNLNQKKPHHRECNRKVNSN